MNTDYIPDIHWKLVNTYHTTSIGHAEMQNTTASVHLINVETPSYANGDKYGEWCRTTLSTKTFTSQSKQQPTVCSIIPITMYGVSNNTKLCIPL